MLQKNSYILLISPFIYSFFFLSNEYFCRRSLCSYWGQYFKISVHLQVSLVYCVNENKDAKAHFAFSFNFSFCHSYITHMDVFCQSFLCNYSIKDYEILCTLSDWQSVLFKWKLRCLSSFCLLFSIFQFFFLSLLYITYGHFSSKFS